MPAAEVAPPAFLALVSHELRWRLLHELARSDRRVGELCTLVGEPQSLVSYHLARLRTGGLISSRRSAADGRDVYYRADVDRCGVAFADASAALHPGISLGDRAARPSAAPRRPARVLFLCTGNSARSQMAAALLEHHAAGRAAARSAGSHPKPSIHPAAVREMACRGIDIADRTTTHLDAVMGLRFDRVITLCDKVREVCPELPGQPATAHWSMPDPAAADGDATGFARAADEIERRVQLLLALIDTTTTSPRRTDGRR